MGKINLIPLEERLQKAGRDSPGYSAIFPLPLDSYFYGWDELLGGSRFMEMYSQEIRRYVPPFDVGEKCTILEALAFSAELPPVERLELLAKILVEPFAAWEEKNQEKKNERRNRHESENNNARHCERNQCRAGKL